MIVRELYAWAVDPYLFDDELTERECTSVGVIVHTGRLERGCRPDFLLLEQLDVEGHPWGIPAGRTEVYEKHPYETAVREVFEETGMSIDTSQMEEFLRGRKKDKTKIVYSYRIPSIEIVSSLENWSYERGTWVTKNQKHSDEIGRMAFVSDDMLFEIGHPFIRGYYRWDVMHDIKAKLLGLRAISVFD